MININLTQKAIKTSHQSEQPSTTIQHDIRSVLNNNSNNNNSVINLQQNKQEETMTGELINFFFKKKFVNFFC